MQRSCDTCGTDYEAQRSTSRYCSSNCRAKAHNSRQHAPNLTVIEPAPLGRVTAASRGEIDALGLSGNPLSEVVLTLSLQIDALADGRTLPNLTREWRAAMAELRASSVGVSANPLDDLRRRRESRAG